MESLEYIGPKFLPSILCFYNFLYIEHEAIYGPLVTNPIRGQMEGGWAPEIKTLLAL
jgi:hypothetical protein